MFTWLCFSSKRSTATSGSSCACSSTFFDQSHAVLARVNSSSLQHPPALLTHQRASLRDVLLSRWIGDAHWRAVSTVGFCILRSRKSIHVATIAHITSSLLCNANTSQVRGNRIKSLITGPYFSSCLHVSSLQITSSTSRNQFQQKFNQTSTPSLHNTVFQDVSTRRTVRASTDLDERGLHARSLQVHQALKSPTRACRRHHRPLLL